MARCTKLLLFLLCTLVAIATSAGAQSVQRVRLQGEPEITSIGLSETHPIYDPYLPLRHFGPRIQSGVIAVREPEVKLRLPKRRYLIGEPIWATLSVRNTDDRQPLRLSPPYVGQHVATAGVWRARWDWLRGGQFTGPFEVIPLNKGRRSSLPQAAIFGGLPIVLKPGETYTATIPLNVAQQFHPVLRKPNGSELAWYAGAGLTEPGLYRLYIQYANLEALVPFGRDPNRAEQLEVMRELRPGEPLELPLQAIVPAPVEVEIVPPQMKAWDPLQQQVELDRYLDLLRNWERAVLSIDGCLIYSPSLDELPAVLESLHESETSIRQSLILTRLRFTFSAIDASDERYRMKVENVLTSAMEARTDVGPGPLADAYDLTICHMLRALSREAEAVELARKLDTPDAAVFLAKPIR